MDSMNLVFSPISILVGILNAELDFKLNPHWVVGPEFAVVNWSIGSLSLKGSSFGATARYYFHPVFSDSWYVAGSAESSNLEVKSGTASASASGLSVSFKGGYHWFWDSFNLQLGLSFTSLPYGKLEVKESNGSIKDSYTPVSTGLEFNFGFLL